MIFQHGNTAMPLETSGALLRDADPALHHMLGFFAWVLDTYVGPRLVAEASLSSAEHITRGVAYAVPLDPEPYLRSEQVRFPLLAVYRKALKLTQHTQAYRADECNVELLYVLPPMTAGERVRLYPILNAARVALDDRAERGADDAYKPDGGTLGSSVWAQAGIMSFEFLSCAFGDVPWSDDLYMPAIIMQATVRERTMPRADAWEQWVDALNTFDLQPVADTQVDEFVVTSADMVDPTLTSVSPATGSSAGGTAVTLTGTGFVEGAAVYFGGILAGLTVTSPTSIATTSPAVSGAGVVDVRVVLPDGREASLSGGFSYT